MEYLNIFCYSICLMAIMLLLGAMLQRVLLRTIVGSEVTFLFLSIFWGSIVLVSAVSLFITRGETINLLFIIVISVLTWFMRSDGQLIKQTQLDQIKLLKSALILFGYYVIFFGLNWLRVTDGGSSFYFGSPLQDVNFYSDCADGLLRYGQENYFGSQNLFSDYHGTTMYHYFDLWIVAILSKISNTPVVFSFNLFLIPFFQVTIAFGYLSLFKKPGWIAIALAFILTFMCGYAPGILTAIPHLSGLLSFNFFNGSYTHHLGLFFLFFLASVCYKDSVKTSIWILCALPLATITALPSIVGGVGLFLLTQFFINRPLVPKESTSKLLVCVTVLTLSVFAFYVCTGNRLDAASSALGPKHLFAGEIIPALKGFIGFNIVTLMPLLIIIVLTAFLAKDIDVSHGSAILLLSPFVYAAGVFSYSIFFHDFDGFQLMKNTTTVLVCVLGVLAVIQFVNEWDLTSSKLRALPALGLVMLCVWYFYSFATSSAPRFEQDNEYMRKVTQEFDSEKNPFYVGILSSNETPTFNLHLHKHGYLKYSENCLGMMYLNDPRKAHLSLEAKVRYDQKSMFARFVNKHKAAAEDSLRADFMTRNNIRYLVVEDSTMSLPLHFQLYDTDRKNGVRIFKAN